MTTQLTMPEIMCGDYLLRQWRLTDIDVLRTAAADPYIPTITTVPPVWTPQAARAFVERQWDRARTGFGYSFAIVDRERSVALGHAGLWLRDLDLGRASLGYWLARSARGKGIAALALTGLSDWAFREPRIARLELYVEPWNAASVRTAEKAGFVREGLLRSWQLAGDERKDMFMYSRVRP